MPDQDAFESYARSALERAGLALGDGELELLRLVDTVQGPRLRALDELDVRGIVPEHDLDPGRAPSEP